MSKTPGGLKRDAAESGGKMKRKVYENELLKLQVELCHERGVPMRTANIGLFRIIEVRLNAAADGL